MNRIIDRLTSRGQRLEIYIEPSRKNQLLIHLDGARVAFGWPTALSARDAARAPAGITHSVGSGKVTVGLTADDMAAYAAACVEDPNAARKALEIECRALVATIAGLYDDQSAAYERAHARQDPRAMAIRARYDAPIAEAEAALASFDAAHPEIIAAIKAERAEATERNKWM